MATNKLFIGTSIHGEESQRDSVYKKVILTDEKEINYEKNNNFNFCFLIITNYRIW